MDEELEHEKAAIDALIAKFGVLMDQVNDLQREIGDRLRAFSKAAPQQRASGKAATEELQDKAAKKGKACRSQPYERASFSGHLTSSVSTVGIHITRRSKRFPLVGDRGIPA